MDVAANELSGIRLSWGGCIQVYQRYRFNYFSVYCRCGQVMLWLWFSPHYIEINTKLMVKLLILGETLETTIDQKFSQCSTLSVKITALYVNVNLRYYKGVNSLADSMTDDLYFNISEMKLSIISLYILSDAPK